MKIIKTIDNDIVLIGAEVDNRKRVLRAKPSSRVFRPEIRMIYSPVIRGEPIEFKELNVYLRNNYKKWETWFTGVY